jgi:hypothetical protein
MLARGRYRSILVLRSGEPGHSECQAERWGTPGKECAEVTVGRVAVADLGERARRLGRGLGQLRDGVAAA